MKEAFEIEEVYSRKRLVVIVAHAPGATVLRYATWTERMVYRWNELWQKRREQSASAATDKIIKRAARASVT